MREVSAENGNEVETLTRGQYVDGAGRTVPSRTFHLEAGSSMLPM
jgi:hypothetical protein